jgi:hypothetical protein
MIGAKKPVITSSEGYKLAKEFAASDLKPKDFCEAKKIPYHILKYWCERYKKHQQITNKPAKFLPVKLSSDLPHEQSLSCMKININNKLTIEIPSDIDLATLTKIFKACQACG